MFLEKAHAFGKWVLLVSLPKKLRFGDISDKFYFSFSMCKICMVLVKCLVIFFLFSVVLVS